eukprot:scaffold185758_cov33-Tisochrysis_lutea.AAC.1
MQREKHRVELTIASLPATGNYERPRNRYSVSCKWQRRYTSVDRTGWPSPRNRLEYHHVK